MQVKKSTLKNIGIGTLILVIVSIVIIAVSSNPINIATTSQVTATDPNSQIINMTAKLGYSPSNITAKANQNTVLRVATNNTFDCSSSIRIPSLNVNKILPANGDTDISLGAQKPGTQISGTCAMGMYNFHVNFS